MHATHDQAKLTICAPSAHTQMKDFMSLYSNLVERCFLSCCQDFTSKALSSKEVSPRNFGGCGRPLAQNPTQR